MRRIKGQISVFLALVFLLVAALIAVTLESARASCLDYLAEQAASSAADSVFAAYDSDLLKDFGLLAVRGRRGNTLTWTAEAERFARAYLQPADGMVKRGDRVGLSSLAVRAEDSVFLTEDNGRIFADAVLDHMKSAGIGQILHDMLERIGLFDEDGAAIAGLYACGSDAGGVYGHCYDVSAASGSQQGWAATSARLAIEHAAATYLA